MTECSGASCIAGLEMVTNITPIRQSWCPILGMSRLRSAFPWTWAVVASRKARRFWKILFLVLLVAVCATEARAWLFRWQARQLLNDLRALEMNKTPAEQALNLREKWPAWDLPIPESRKQPCKQERCDFDVAVMEWDWLVRLSLEDRWWASALKGVTRTLEPFGLRWSYVAGTVKIRHGLVVGVSIDVTTTTREGSWQFALISSAHANPNLVFRIAPDERPNLHVRFQGPPNHGGCKPCKMTLAEYTPQISRDEFLKVTSFDLACLTSLRLCNQYGDMMPEVKRMVESDEAREVVERLSRVFPCTTRTVETLGRDVHSIARMRVRRLGKGHAAGVSEYEGVLIPVNGVQEVEYDLVDKLKWHGEESTPKSLEHVFGLSGAMVDPQTHLLSREWFRPGKELIVFLDPPRPGCGAVPATPDNLRAVQAGIAEDRSEDWK